MSASPTESGRVAWMLVPSSPQRFDGVRDFARLLGTALAPAQQVRFFTAQRDGDPAGMSVVRGWGSLSPVAAAARPDVIYVNYIPTAWLRADTLPLLRALKHCRAAGTRVIVIAHEYQLDPGPAPKRKAARLLFRRMARAFARRADAFVATHAFVAGLARADGIDRFCRLVTIPAGSSVSEPVSGAAAGRLPRMVMFGQPAGMHPGMTDAALREAKTRGVSVIWICRNAEEARGWMARGGIDQEWIRLLEGLSAEAIGSELSASTAGLAPVIDGVSARRTTVAAMLQHGLPIAGTDGRATDPVFRESPAFALAPVGDAGAMTAAVARVLGDAGVRATMGIEARAFFDAHLAWPRIAAAYLELTA